MVKKYSGSHEQVSGLSCSYSSVQNMASNSGSSRPGDVPDTNDRGGQDEDQQQPFLKRPKVNYSKVHEEFTVTQVCTLAGAHPEVFEL